MLCAKLAYWRFLVVIVFHLMIWNAVTYAQQEKNSALTTKDGLPSNNIYRCLEDKNGFLWITTDAGVARFDGKHFQVFTTQDGLPDNDVFSLVMEKGGRIWANCFNQVPSYFDEVQNRFVVPHLDKELANKMANTLGTDLRPLPDGGIVYTNRDKWVVFKNGREQRYSQPIKQTRAGVGLVKEYGDGSILGVETTYYSDASSRYGINLHHTKGERILESAVLVQVTDELKNESLMPPKINSYSILTLENGVMYLGLRDVSKIYVYTDIQIDPIRWKEYLLRVPEPYINFFLTANRLAIVAESGKIYLYDKNTLQHLRTISSDYLVNSYFNDSEGNEWISTINKGLVVYRNQPLQALPMPGYFSNTNFMSVIRKKDGTLFAGNYQGQVVEIKNGKLIVHQVINKSPARIRKILTAGNNVYSFSEEGIYCNYKTRIPSLVLNGISLSFGKTAILCNDTTILVATNRDVIGLNTKTNKPYALNSTLLRVTAMAKTVNNWVYFGTINGLYKYNYKTNSKYIPVMNSNSVLKKRISGLCYASDGLLWVTQSDNTILALKDDQIILKINLNNTLSNSANKHIVAGKPGELWISTSNGIKVIQYRFKGKQINYSAYTISAKDGLASNEVEEIFYQDKKMYVTTSNGITVIPEDYVPPKTDIPTYLIQMTVNQRDTIIADRYRLKYGQRNVSMRFSGIDLNGYFDFLQYRLDNQPWAKLQGNTLNIQLLEGKHSLKVRAVDANGNISKKILTIQFDITVPFWLNLWVWLAIAIGLQLLIIYFIGQRQKKRKEIKLAKKMAAVQTAALEQQAFTSLMNPHFMFNALNSIQHYINVQDRQNANRYLSDFASLIRKNFEAAQDSFIPLEEEIENTKLYLSLEQMRFSEKFSYKITIEPNLEVEDWMIPTMILQPLLENALLHGLMPSDIAGKLSICFMQQNKNLLIIIIDNGIGLINSEVLKSGTAHKSRGMELIRKRIKALNSFDSQAITIIMEPAFKSKKNPGNKISFLIPATMHQAWLKVKHP
ncbi:MAG: histidine kinase [Bacteroidota bacterium]